MAGATNKHMESQKENIGVGTTRCTFVIMKVFVIRSEKKSEGARERGREGGREVLFGLISSLPVKLIHCDPICSCIFSGYKLCWLI